MLFAPLVSTASIRSFRRVGQRVGQTRKPSAKTAPQESKSSRIKASAFQIVILPVAVHLQMHDHPMFSYKVFQLCPKQYPR